MVSFSGHILPPPEQKNDWQTDTIENVTLILSTRMFSTIPQRLFIQFKTKHFKLVICIFVHYFCFVASISDKHTYNLNIF